MNTLHFKYALEIEKTRSITQAAENLYMAQPNLSKAIKEFEESLGFSIFERGSRGVIPTSEGAEFLQYARNVLAQIDKIENISNQNSNDLQKFNISIPRGSYIASGVVHFVDDLDFNHGINVNVQETNSMKAIANVAENRFNLGIIRYELSYEHYFRDYLKDKNLKSETIWEFEYLATLSDLHPLANKKDLHSNDLMDYIEITHGDNSVPYLQTKGKTTDQKKKKILIYERCSQFELLEQIQGSYMWASPIPQHMLERYHLRQRKCLGMTRRYKDVLIYANDYKFSELDKKFIGKLYESKNEVSFEEVA